MRMRHGHTLIEVLIAITLFFMVLLLCGELAVTGMRTKMSTEDKNVAFRSATIALDQLNRELLRADRVLLPPEVATPTSYGAELHPGEGVTLPLVLRSDPLAAGPASVVGYRFDRTQRTLTRILYRPDFNPADPLTHTPRFPPKVAAAWLEDFSLRVLDPQTTHGALTVQTEMKVATQQKDQVAPSLRLSTYSRLRTKP